MGTSPYSFSSHSLLIGTSESTGEGEEKESVGEFGRVGEGVERPARGVEGLIKAFLEDSSLPGHSCESVVLSITGNDEAAAW